MKILHVAYNYYPDPTGGAVRTRYLVQAQARLGLDPVVLSSPFQPPEGREQSGGVEVYDGIRCYRSYNGADPARFMAPNKPWWERAARLACLFRFAQRIKRVAGAEQAEVIHAHSSAFCGLAAAIAGRRLGLPVVYEVRSLIEEGMDGAGPLVRWAYRRLDSVACRLASHVVVICEGLRQEMTRRGVAPRKITVVANGVDAEAHAPAPAEPASGSQFTLGYIGTLAHYEGLDLLIDAAALLVPKHPELRVLIVGDGPARAALEQQARRLGLSGIVRFTGCVPHDQIGSCYREIDLFVLPRRPSRLTDAVTPLKPLEIMAHGKPLLAGDCGGHRELIDDGVNGLLFPASSGPRLARRIAKLLENRDSLVRLGAQARDWVARHGSWEAQCRPVVNLYQKLAAERGARRPGVLLVAPAPSAITTGGVEKGVGMMLASELLARHSIALWDRRGPERREGSWLARAAHQVWNFTRFAVYVAAHRPRVVHIKSSSGVNFAQSALYCLIARLALRRVLLQLHSGDFADWYQSRSALGRFAIRIALRLPGEILVLSECWREFVAHLVPRKLIHVVPNGVELPALPPRPSASGASLRVVTIATLGAHKGHFDILAAAARLRGQPIRFMLAGPDGTSGRGEGEQVRRRALELDLLRSVEFLGPLGPAEKWDLLASADVFLLPSRAEGMPNAVLEAMAASLPVVTAPVGSLPEMLGEGARFVKPSDPADLAAALLELLHDPTRRAAMGRSNRARVEARYSSARVERLLDDLYTAPAPAGVRAVVRRLRAPALFLLAAEVAARLAAPAPPEWRWPQTRFEASATLGFSLQPNQVSFTADQPFRTNSLGLRGPEIRARKPPGTRRILILGDSIASGYGVSEDETFARRLERRPRASDPHPVEVVNAGVPSYNTAQEVEFLAERGVALDPDIVLLALYWNDIHDKNGIGVDREGRLIESNLPPRSELLASQAAYSARNLLKRSRLLYLLLDRSRAIENVLRPPLQRETQLAILEGLDHPRVSAGWREVERHLAHLAALCRERNIAPLVLILPMPQQLTGRFPRVRYQSVVRAMCERQRLPCLDLQPAFERAGARGGPLFLPYDGDHPNARGHAVIAEELSAALSRKETFSLP